MRLMGFISPGRIVVGVAVLAASLNLTAPAWAQYNQMRTTLKGITAVGVTVDIDPALKDDNPTLKDLLQTDVELRLRKAGIPVTPSMPVRLQVSVQAYKLQPIGYALAFPISLYQWSSLLRDPQIIAPAITWTVLGVGMIRGHSSEDVRLLREAVADGVDQFINAYLEQNPKP